mmetsp:Transcript_40113/g.103824  ORF Transcript_40113/g.103824 Transcript_40113/m.103824 type:complete len:256 (+) Transcript_40113:379-1146(+)
MRRSTADLSRACRRAAASSSSATVPAAPSSDCSEAAAASRRALACSAAAAAHSSDGGSTTSVMVGAMRMRRESRTKRRLTRSLSTHISPARAGSEMATRRHPSRSPAWYASLSGATTVMATPRPRPTAMPPTRMDWRTSDVGISTRSSPSSTSVSATLAAAPASCPPSPPPRTRRRPRLDRLAPGASPRRVGTTESAAPPHAVDTGGGRDRSAPRGKARAGCPKALVMAMSIASWTEWEARRLAGSGRWDYAYRS